MDDLRYIERATGSEETEAIYGRWALSLLYGHSRLARLASCLLLPFFAKIPWFSKLYGWVQTLSFSRKKIAPFIRAFRVDASEFLEPPSSYRSFNEFFVRRLKLSCRPVAMDPRTAVLPADGRYLVFPSLDKAAGFYAKGQRFSLESFLSDPALVRRYDRGSMVIARLCPTDYHRFHFPVSGTAGKPRLIRGPLYSVNPVALCRRLRILWENKRMLTEIDSVEFGEVLMVEIGATFVGSIHQTYAFGSKVQKGEEKGFFSFGGSCIILLFQQGRIAFDTDFAAHSARSLETRGLFGSSLGIAK